MGLIFDIKRYAINDGPGIRTTVFMKGCPLSCVWCHNPEGVSSRKQKLYTKKKCIGCRTCVENCPQKALALTPEGIVTDNALCHLCDKCAGGLSGSGNGDIRNRIFRRLPDEGD